MPTGAQTSPLSSELKLNSNQDDDTFSLLKEHFVKAPGKGRPKTLPEIQLTNGLLIQLYFLKREGDQFTFEDVKCWLCKLIPAVSTESRKRISHHVEAAYKTCLKMTERDAVLYIRKVFDFHALSEPLSALGLNRLHLLNIEPYVPNTNSNHQIITNDAVRSLEQFQVLENFPVTFVVKWIRRLDLAEVITLNDSQVRSKVLATCKKIRAMVKNKKIQDLECFLCQPFFTSPVPKLTPTKSSTPDTKFKKINEMLQSKLNEHILKADILTEERDELRAKNETLTGVKTLLDNKVKENKKLVKEIKCKDVQIDELSQTRTYKTNVLLRKDITNLTDSKNDLIKKNDAFKNDVDILKKKLKRSQKQKSKIKRQCDIEKSKKLALLKEFQVSNSDQNNPVQLRQNNTNRFNNSVRIGYMDLLGKADIAASKCSEVVKIVGKHIFGYEFDTKELPSTSTTLNFADEAQHITMHQVVDTIKESSHFTYASDGTSRQKKNYLERHIILADKTQLSLGFTEIAVDDAKTLLDQTLELFNELTDIYSETENENRDELFKELIIKLKCLMSDRAAVNKCFNAKFSEFKESLVDGTINDITTHYLYCNAHFLLGLAKATLEAIKGIEKELVNEIGPLGRDAFDKFKSFNSSEPSAVRLIRTAAECLGPRCDEKSGSRAEWLAYCEEQGISSKFCSYRNNRFNNLFENAAATVYHFDHINDFLTNYCTHSNMKLESVHADIKDKNVKLVVGAVAVFNCSITGPYWQLMNSNCAYGEFSKYVEKMESAFNSISIQGRCDADSIFSEFPVDNDHVVSFLSHFGNSDLVLNTIQSVAIKCNEVLRRQLADFLHGGIYGNVIDPATKSILMSCPLTNLAGERLFGDMDYDMLKRRHATTHHRSSIIMWKHNNTSKWLSKKDDKQVEKILNSAIKNRQNLRKKHLDSIKKVGETIKAKLLQHEHELKEKEIDESKTKTLILDHIIVDGGLCKTKNELDQLFESNKLESLKFQIRYRKLFMNQNHLKLTGSKKQLYSCLLGQIEIDGNTFQSDDSDMEVDY